MTVLAPFWSGELVGALALNAVVQAIQIGAYAARIAGVQTGRVATSISLFNLFVTASRLANLAYAPLLGTVSDAAAHLVTLPGVDTAAVYGRFEWQLRAIVFAGTVGTAAGAALLPVFVHLFRRGIASFERRGSLPAALVRLADPAVVGGVVRAFRIPSGAELRSFSPRHVPTKLLVANVIVTGIYAIGVVAAVYASVLDPARARTATLLSGIVNGIATIAFTLVVDPTSSLIVDQAVKGEKTLAEVRSLVVWLSLTAILGTLLSQLILWPAAVFIAGAAHLFHPR